MMWAKNNNKWSSEIVYCAWDYSCQWMHLWFTSVTETLYIVGLKSGRPQAELVFQPRYCIMKTISDSCHNLNTSIYFAIVVVLQTYMAECID